MTNEQVEKLIKVDTAKLLGYLFYCLDQIKEIENISARTGREIADTDPHFMRTDLDNIHRMTKDILNEYGL